MPRVLLVLLAVLAAGLGFVVEVPWLYAVAGVLVLGAIALWIRERMKARRRKARRATPPEEAEEQDELQSLGIMDIRPREKGAEEEQTPSSTEASPEGATMTEEPSADGPTIRSRDAEPGPEAEERSRERGAEEATEAEEATSEPVESSGEQASLEGDPSLKKTTSPDEEHAAEEIGLEKKEEPVVEDEPPGEEDVPFEEEALSVEDELPGGEAVGESFVGESPFEEPAAEAELRDSTHQEALDALIRTVRLATGARVACLLAQKEMALAYRIEAFDASDEAPPLRAVGTTFSTETPLLAASAARRTVTQRPVGEEGWSASLLGYYRSSEFSPPEQVALIPVLLPDDPTTRFVVLDGDRQGLETREALARHFAALFAELLASPVEGEEQSATSSSAEVAREAPDDQALPSENGRARPAQPHQSEESSPRPRREIIAEEMDRARSQGRALALTLVYLNRAETVAERGEEEVRAAERALRARLRQSTPDDGRVVRFGELTYGIFLPRESAEAERWAVALQDELAQASDPLEGGVSVGLALMRGPEQSPEALRENATNALREAYTTGTCTVLE